MKINRILCVILSVVMVVAYVLTGCSTQETQNAGDKPMKNTILPVLMVSMNSTLKVPMLASLTQAIALDQSEVTITRLQKVKLTASFAPADASTKVKWTSSNRRVASVTSTGLVKGVKAGTSVITCTARDGSGVSVSCTVTVLPIYPASVKINKAAVNIKPGKSATVKATVLPRNTDYKTPIWASDNPAVATVNGKGKIRGVGEGTATVTATTQNGIVSACTVTVSRVYPTGVRLTKTALTLKTGRSYSLKAILTPKKCDLKAMAWASDNPAIVSVTSKGKIRAVSPGTATITATTVNGLVASCTVTVPGTPIAPPAPPPAPPAPTSLSGLVIGIDPGHQAHSNSDQEPVSPGSSETKKKVSSGTQGRYTDVAEYKVNLQVGLKLKKLLTDLGATVVMTRESHDVDISNKERAEMMNNAGAALVIRIHCNGSNDNTVHGAFVLVPSNSCTEPINGESKKAGRCIIDAFCAATGAKNLGLTARSDQTGFNWSTVPVCNIEMGHMTNKDEDNLLVSDDYQNLCAQGIANGIADYFS